MRSDGSYTDEERETIFAVGAFQLPSFVVERYRRPAEGSSGTAWILGFLGLAVPFVSLAGIWSAYRAAVRGNRLALAAAVWCVATGLASVAFWVDVGATPPGAPPPPTIEVLAVEDPVVVPAVLLAELTTPADHHAAVDVEIVNPADERATVALSGIDVLDQDGLTLAWVTELDAASLDAGEAIEVRLYVAMQSGSTVEAVELLGVATTS